MTLELQKAYITPILEELNKINRIINEENTKVDKETERQLVIIYNILELE